MSEQEIGVVTHYFGHLQVAAIELKDGELSVGDTIHIKGHTTNLTVPIACIQIEHVAVQTAHAGDSIGIKVPDHVREHDQVFKAEG